MNGRKWLRTSGSDDAGVPFISVMTYNVLARRGSLFDIHCNQFTLVECLIKRELYPSSSKTALKGKTRIPRILEEIIRLQPDVACLQEVDFFESHFHPSLSDAGYECLYLAKTPMKPTSHGLLIAFKRSRFTKIDYHELRYDSLNDFNCSHVVLETGNSAQILRLRWNQSGKEFFVTNTHLYWRPEACAIKLKQSFMLIEKLLDLRGDNQDPVILCGDWNTSPQNILYSVLTRKSLVSNEDIQQLFTKQLDHGDQMHPAALEISLEFLPRIPNLRSAYSIYGDLNHISNQGILTSDGDSSRVKEPPYTTCTTDWKGTLDYIFLWGTWSVTELLSLPAESDVDSGIPNDVFPSDHVSLLARLRFPLPTNDRDV